MDGALVAPGASPANTPSNRDRGRDQEALDQTPSKHQKGYPISTASKHGPGEQNRVQATQEDIDLSKSKGQESNVPEWLPEFLTDVAALLSAPAHFESTAARGAKAILPKSTSDSQSSTPSKKQLRVPGLVIAVVLLSLERSRQKFDARNAAKAAVKELIVRRVITMIQFGKTVAEAEALVEERGSTWRKMSWYQAAVVEGRPTITETTDPDVEAVLAQSSDEVNAESSTQRNGTKNVESGTQEPHHVRTIEREMPRGGLRTMLQPKVDWLSPERRLHYAKWKEQIMQRIEEMEQETIEAS